LALERLESGIARDSNQRLGHAAKRLLCPLDHWPIAWGRVCGCYGLGLRDRLQTVAFPRDEVKGLVKDD
jgi:hypothetical protein